jgi:hypothetical protein
VSRRGWLLAAVLALGLVAGLVLGARGVEAGGSTLSHGPAGWMAARLYLQARGTPTELLRAPLAEDLSPAQRRSAARRALVLVFPWQSRALDVDPLALREHLDAGGDVLFAYSGEIVPTPAEEQLLGFLGAPAEQLRERPLAPWRWRRRAAEPWRLHPATRWPAGPTGLELRRRRWLPTPPRGSALLVGPEGRAVVAAWRVGRGRLLLLPAELLCNARLAAPLHGALLESLRGWLRGPWLFDEYHHGLGTTGAALPRTTRRGFDLLLAQLLLLYVMAALALGRRLGPAWRERPPLVGSAATFLLRLGALHHRLGHHRAGAELLLQRAAALDRRFAPDDELVALAARGDAAALVEVGQRVAAGGRRERPPR